MFHRHHAFTSQGPAGMNSIDYLMSHTDSRAADRYGLASSVHCLSRKCCHFIALLSRRILAPTRVLLAVPQAAILTGMK